MFFAISKILYFIIQPIIWLIIGIGRAFFKKNSFRRFRILRGVFWGLIIFTNPFLANRVFHTWETPATPVSSLRDTFDVGIVLGGYSEFSVYPIHDRLNVSFAANRLLDAVVLYKKGHIKKILLTGGDGKLIGDKINEANQVLPFLLTLGIPSVDILIENQSKNTYENAIFSKRVLEMNGLQQSKCLLITSAFHMRRSIGCFKKANINFEPFCAHFMAERVQVDMRSTIFPDPMLLWKWEVFIKEWVGYIVYKLKGYI